MISYTTQNKACKTSELKLQLSKCPQGYSWVRVYQNRMKPYGKQNRWSSSLRFCPLLKVFWRATPMSLVEIHYFLCDNPIDMSSEKKLVHCIVKLNALLLFPPAGPWRISSVSGDNVESTSQSVLVGFQSGVLCALRVCVSVPSNHCFTDGRFFQKSHLSSS